MSGKKTSAALRQPVRPAANDDTAVRSLEPEDRSKLAMDAWEPSLLRKLLEAQGKLPRKRS